MKPILAQIGNRELSAAEKEQLNKLRKQTLEKMVNDVLLAQEIKKYQISVPDEVVEDEIRRTQEQRGMSAEQFAAAVEKDGLTMEDFRSRLKGMIENRNCLVTWFIAKCLLRIAKFKKNMKPDTTIMLLKNG